MKHHGFCEIYTDGSVGKNGDGGWAFVVLGGPSFFGWEEDTTINRMELLACIKALEWAVLNHEHGIFVRVVTDSSYVRTCFREKWYLTWRVNGWKNSRNQPVANQDLWERLIELHEAVSPKWKKVKGHAGHPGNEEADRLAVNARVGRLNGDE